MTNGRGAGMASFMTKKKKYKFQVDVCLEELLEVPFVSAVLFAKLRLLDGGNFQDHSSREEVRDHKVKWGAKFSFPCKMTANASTGIMERCTLRISIRRESKGGRSFNKLGFVDLNLAEYAGSGVIHRKALLEGYDTRHRQDNSMLRYSLTMNMLQGDILFKVPSPSLKHKQVTDDELPVELPRSDEFSSGSVAGSIASGSSGFGSLTKKRPNLLSSDLVIGQTLTENNIPVTLSTDCNDIVATTTIMTVEPQQQQQPHIIEDAPIEPGHSRNSSNTSQLSKASGYSSIHSHSRQSSSGDSGHIRSLSQHRSIKLQQHNTSNKLNRAYTCPKRFHIPQTIISSPHPDELSQNGHNKSIYYTPRGFNRQMSSYSSSTDEYLTPDESLNFTPNFHELHKSPSASFVENRIRYQASPNLLNLNDVVQRSTEVQKSKSEFEIPRLNPSPQSNDKNFSQFFKSDSLFSFLTPILNRKNVHQSTPNHISPTILFRVPSSASPVLKSLPETRTTSLNSLQLDGNVGGNGLMVCRGLPHRKLLEGSTGGKLAPVAISPDEMPSSSTTTTTIIVTSDISQNPTVRRTSITTNPSASSVVLSETGSLDRAKSAHERRKKMQSQDNDVQVPGRVEITRVNPDDLIDEIIKNSKLEQPVDDSAESSGLQLFIAKDGTAALGNHEVKSQMATGGVQVFKQVVMDDR